MRLRHKIIAGFALAIPMVMVPAAAASAETAALPVPAEIGECKGAEVQEIVTLSAEGKNADAMKKVEDCYSAASPILPKTSELIWGGIAWLLVMVVVVKAAVPMMQKTMAARTEKIKGDLDAAEAAKNSANAELADYRAKLADAQSEANRIIDEARQSAEGVRKDLIARAETEAAEIRTRANDEVRIASERAMADLRQQVASMSVDLAGKIVEKNLDQATQQQLIDSYINSVGSN